MADNYYYEKDTKDLVFAGWESGIGSSPHKGTARLENMNISTESGEVLCNFARSNQMPNIFNGSLSVTSGNTNLLYSPGTIIKGNWIRVNTGQGNIPAGLYWLTQNGTPGTLYNISTSFFGSSISPNFTGAILFENLTINQAIQGAIENYFDTSGNIFQRMWIIDNTGQLFVKDTNPLNIMSNQWFLTVPFGSGPGISTSFPNSNVTGLAYQNGFIHAWADNSIWAKPTVNLQDAWILVSDNLNSLPATFTPHFAYNFNGSINYTDSNFVGTLLPTSNSGATTNPNLWTFGSYTASTTTLTITNLIGGDIPLANQTITFFPANGGTIYTGVVIRTTYYVKDVTYNSSGTAITFTVSATVGGSAISFSGGSGTQYFNSYGPTGSSDQNTFSLSTKALLMDSDMVASSISFLGTNLLIGGNLKKLFIWNTQNSTPSNFVALNEGNITFLQPYSNNVFIFGGSKGNVWVTSGSAVSIAISVPDYLSGQIEPYYTFGGVSSARGRIFFGIEDQNTNHTGQAGGVYSFVPTQGNLPGEIIGSALRCENLNSYGTHNGLATVILCDENQKANGIQYEAAWTSSVSNPTYGIDSSGTVPVTTATFETQIVPTGNLIGKQKKTFSSIEFKLSTALASNESLAINYRQNLGDSFASAGTIQMDSSNLAGYISPITFQGGQWLQLQVVLTSNATSSSSFVRLVELRVHP